MTVRLHPKARACWPWLPHAAPPATWWVSEVGQLVPVLEDGSCEPLEGFSSIAQNPCARPRGRRGGDEGREGADRPQRPDERLGQLAQDALDMMRRAGGEGSGEEARTGDFGDAP